MALSDHGSGGLPERAAVQLAFMSTLILIFCLAAAIRLIGLSSYSVRVDEYYHVLVGQSFLDSGNFALYDGEYTRGAAYSALVSAAFCAFDSTSLLVARLPALVAGSLLPAMVVGWLASKASFRAAMIAGLLLCVSGIAIELSQFARFYSLQALCIWISATLLYDLLHAAVDRHLYLKFLLLVVSLLLAVHLQKTTMIAIVAMAAFAIGVKMWELRLKVSKEKYLVSVFLVAAALLSLAIGGYLIFGDEFRFASQWNEAARNDVLFYAKKFGRNFALLTILSPLAFLVALRKYPKITLFLTTMLVLPLAIHSFGGMKLERYTFYTIPFFFGIWGIALDLFWQIVASWVGKRPPRVASRRFAVGGILAMTAGLITALDASVWHGISSTAVRSLKAAQEPSLLIAHPDDPPWANAADLKKVVAQPGVFLTADDVRTLYYVGPYDVVLNRNRISDIDPSIDFGVDFRTGHRAVGSGRYISQIIECTASGTVLVPDNRWRLKSAVTDDMADAIEANTVSIEPPIPGFRISRWRHQPNASEACSRIVAAIQEGRSRQSSIGWPRHR